MGGTPRVWSYVMRVSNMARSIDFYCDVFECQVTLRDDDSALLLTPDGFQIYLRAHGPAKPRGIMDLGVEHVIWSVTSEAELTQIARRLQTHDPSTYTSTLHGVTFVDAIDPDHNRVLVTYPTPQQVPREVIEGRFR
ncbi:MAG: hypothetical protein NVS4B6_13530 [Mycobacterium sp.]